MELNLNAAQAHGGSHSRLAIECSPDVLDQILAHVEQGFYSVPHGGAEVGGVLYGSYDASRIVIQAARPLLCEHAYGPSFNLSGADYSRLAALVQAPAREPDFAGMAVVGWYHSHTRSEISFADADLGIHDRFFPKPWQVALVLRPAAMRPTEVGLFVRDANGTMRRSAPAVEASLKPAGAARNERAQPVPGTPAAPRTVLHRNRPAAAAETPEPMAAAAEPVAAAKPEPVAAAAAEPVVALASKRARRKDLWRWAVAAALFLVAVASAGYLSRGYWLPQRPAPEAAGLQLHATDRNGLLEIAWDGNLPALRQARNGTLEITEGSHVHILPVDAEFLRGGAISYARHSEVVTVRISVTLQDGSELHQQWAYVGDLGSGKAGPSQIAAQQPAAPEATPEPPRKQTADARALPGPPAPTSRASAVQPAIPRSLPPAVKPPGVLPNRAGTQAPAHAATARPTPEPHPATAAAVVRGKPLPQPAASATPPPASAGRAVAQVVQPSPPTPSAPPTSEPVAKPQESHPAPLPTAVTPPPAPQPAVTAPSLSGEWTFGRTSPSGSPFPPESVALSLSEQGGILQGTLSGRYRTPKSSGQKPDVRFSFQGAARPGNMRFPWATSDGKRGSVELIRLPNKSDSIEVVWYSQDRRFIFDDVLVRAK